MCIWNIVLHQIFSTTVFSVDAKPGSFLSSVTYPKMVL